MKKIFVVISVVTLLGSMACKKACYQCRQYCSYCVSAKDSSIAYKICANKGNVIPKIDSIYRSYKDSGFVCNRLNDDRQVCDSKNSINKGVDYYEMQDYFCQPK